MKLAVIETGGKQYLVKPNDKIYIEKLPQEVGVKFDFDKVLLLAPLLDKEGVGPLRQSVSEARGGIEIGKPYLQGKKISAEVVEQKRLPKVTVFRYHSKTRYRKKKGHRQYTSVVKISPNF